MSDRQEHISGLAVSAERPNIFCAPTDPDVTAERARDRATGIFAPAASAPISQSVAAMAAGWRERAGLWRTIRRARRAIAVLIAAALTGTLAMTVASDRGGRSAPVADGLDGRPESTVGVKRQAPAPAAARREPRRRAQTNLPSEPERRRRRPPSSQHDRPRAPVPRACAIAPHPTSATPAQAAKTSPAKRAALAPAGPTAPPNIAPPRNRRGSAAPMPAPVPAGAPPEFM
jgi:hypothetical protein